jgi:transmembrane sensor
MAQYQVTSELLKRYLEGNVNEEEAASVEEWYAQLESDKDLKMPSFNKDAHLKKVYTTIDFLEEGSTLAEESTSVVKVWWRIAVAAIILIASFVGYHIVNSPMGSSSDQILSGTTIVKNDTRQILRYILPDSSAVWLNPDAELTLVDQFFDQSTRLVKLRGEAFFDIKRDENRPFFVEIDKMKIKVLGTSFHVFATPGKPQYEVAVITGKVEVISSPKSGNEMTNVILLPEEKVVFEVQSGELTTSTLAEKSDHAVPWRNVSLTFDDVTLNEFVDRMESKFGMTFELADPAMGNCKIKATFENQKMVEILEVASEMLEMEYQIKSDTIRLEGNGCIQ